MCSSLRVSRASEASCIYVARGGASRRALCLVQERPVLAHVLPDVGAHCRLDGRLDRHDQRLPARPASAADGRNGRVRRHHHQGRADALGARPAARAAARTGLERRHPHLHARRHGHHRSAAAQSPDARNRRHRARAARRRHPLFQRRERRARLLYQLRYRGRQVLADARARAPGGPDARAVARLGGGGRPAVGAGRSADLEPRQSAAGAPDVRRTRHRQGRAPGAAARKRLAGDHRSQSQLQPDGRRPGPGREGPRGNPGRHLARFAHAARAHGSRGRDGQPVAGSTRRHAIGHCADGRHHRPVPRLRQAD